ncbi:uncharacterized protein LOC126749457 [Anthonomus grandis grandis]|uniref:uncharacterized protein LOC126749457 n=1 Tax=Anthonomus grandis grandis TaxID=2921223 RepID=UPI0021657B2C|nr:uncharacterized protein LOC126749457 [Anthonomus grandis grandis]
MSTVERKEYHETRMMRGRSPVRGTRTSNHNLAHFDSNLDNLLEDLQNSVSRPGSSLGQTATSSYKETSKYVSGSCTEGHGGRTNSLGRVSHLKPSNPMTEFSSDDAYSYTSPDGREKVHTYKKEKYVYGKNVVERDVEPERARMQNSINQLDSLLDDLQQVKKSSYTEKESFGTESGFQSKSVNRELHYGDTPPPSKSRTIERTAEKREYRRDTGEGTYGDLRPIRSPSPSSRTSTLTKQTKVSNVHEYPLRVVETPVPDIDPEVLAHLDPNLHPAGNTKVTTTIKTYTYEIPGSGNYPTQVREDTTVNERYLDQVERYPNDSITTPSKSFVYNKVSCGVGDGGVENKENYYKEHYHQPPKDVKTSSSYKEIVQDDVYYPPYQKPAPPAGQTTLKEEITTIRNYQPEIPRRNQTYVYNESTTTKNIQNTYPPAPPPPVQETREYVINRETNVINRNQPPMSERGYPVYNPPTSGPETKTYVLKETNYQNGGGGGGGYPNKEVNPREPINIQYSYKSTNTTQNRYKGDYQPEETQTLLPRKFPTSNTDAPDGPPKRIDDLMASIGQEPANSALNASFTAHEKEVAHKRVADTLSRRQNPEAEDLQQKKEPPTKNVSGPPVYYPPGHEMFAKKEEEGGGGAWRAQGEYAKGSGKYMYEAESGSKTKTKSGMAVVPVCLPLCCGLPCTII